MQTRRLLLATLCLSLGLAACGPAGPRDLGRLGGVGKADFAGFDYALPTIEASGRLTLTFQAAGPFVLELSQPGVPSSQAATARLILDDGAAAEETASSRTPRIERAPATGEERSYTLTVVNRSYSKQLDARLVGRALAGPADPAEPTLEVLFTKPTCPAYPGKAPANVRCDHTHRDASRAASGVMAKLQQWVDETRQVKEAHPERDVRIAMGYLNWSNYGLYEAICKATKAGVKFEAFIDRANNSSTKPAEKMKTDSACGTANVTVRYLGGRTANYLTDWRLMHIKMILLETGEPTSRVIFSSANLSSYGDSINFENWVFATFPSQSHFIQAHRCAVQGLRGDAYQGNSWDFPISFEQTYEACIAPFAASADPRYQVWFTPDKQKGAGEAAVKMIEDATTSVEMVIQHFSATKLARRLRNAGKAPTIKARLVLDDDTYYAGGESGSDYKVYAEFLCWQDDETAQPGDPCDMGIDIRHMQTKGYQYQHNKYIIVDEQKVFCGAGNFTEVAFGATFDADRWKANYENFYLIDSAEFAAKFRAHFDRLFDLGAAAAELPASSSY